MRQILKSDFSEIVRFHGSAALCHAGGSRGAPEMLRLLPEEDRYEEYIEVYTGFALSLGEDDGGVTYTAPDRILWNGDTWRVVKVRDWAGFGYVQALAVRMHE